TDGASNTRTVQHTRGENAGTIEVSFSSAYPSGHSLIFTIIARSDTEILSISTEQLKVAGPTCDTLQISLDGGMQDLGSDSGSVLVATPRLVAPLSTSTVTQQTPTLRWALGPGRGAALVDFCKDRSCEALLGVTAQVSADQMSAVPTAPLPPG